ncbi:activator-dependent family glycosyltransferase [Nocardiopsis eucommiae]|uniref:Activator-dependent family glycosyltransferase n=1 Tax=Nocardiopsis eucommiae TaxID=2831970 RepID=A0A975LAW6_9ACTN|nr:activator-dependent family glycosyltransferase [Nocardiopsis eucommiae]
MRVLIAAYSEKTHFYNLVPIAWALRTAGHEVRVVSQPSLTSTIVEAGLTAVAVGRDHSFMEVMESKEEDEGWADRVTSVMTDPENTDWEGLYDFFEDATVNSFRTFNDGWVDELVEYAREWRPDLVLWEAFTFAGAVAARVVGAAHVRVLWGADVLTRARHRFVSLLEKRSPEDRSDPLGEWLGEILGRYGHTFDEEIVTGQRVLDQAPTSMRLPDQAHTVPVRYVPYNGPAEVPSWLLEPPRKPRVCVTAGMSMRNFFGFDMIPLEILQPFADLDVEVVATLVPGEGGVPDLPPNVRLVDFVPMNALLPTCSAVVHIGGAGVVSTALLHGVPQLTLVPGLWDTVVRARALRDNGAGLLLMPGEDSPEAVRDNVRRLVEEPSFREAAELLRQEVLSQPTPNDVVPLLEELCGHRGTPR